MKQLVTLQDLYECLNAHKNEPIFFQDPKGDLFLIYLDNIKLCNAYTMIKGKRVSEYILKEKECLIVEDCVVISTTENGWENDYPGKAWEK